MPWRIDPSPGKTGPTLLFDPLDLSFFSERPSSVLDDWSLILPYRNKNSTERRIENMSIGPFANWWTDISIAKHSTQDEWASPAFVYTYYTHWYNLLKNVQIRSRMNHSFDFTESASNFSKSPNGRFAHCIDLNQRSQFNEFMLPSERVVYNQ